MAGLGPVFLRRGFEIGELLIPGLLLVLGMLGFLAFFGASSAVVVTGIAGGSRSISMGELLECVLLS